MSAGGTVNRHLAEQAVEHVDVTSVSMAGLFGLYIAFAAAKELMLAHTGLPENQGDENDILSDEVERLCCVLEKIQEAASAREPDNPIDRGWRAEIIVRWGLECGQWGWVAEGLDASRAA
ncbi:hypothetical protein ACFQU1_20665 [Chelatococcus sp. GCM10030263]|uniref:hypothetical protein n=1 Tax=Chelatococcus sp. GCM10030263 TaxID=3273387 RepID=UPI003623A2F1